MYFKLLEKHALKSLIPDFLNYNLLEYLECMYMYYTFLSYPFYVSRQRAAGGRVPGGDGRRVSKAMPAPDANAELAASIQVEHPSDTLCL